MPAILDHVGHFGGRGSGCLLIRNQWVEMYVTPTSPSMHYRSPAGDITSLLGRPGGPYGFSNKHGPIGGMLDRAIQEAVCATVHPSPSPLIQLAPGT